MGYLAMFTTKMDLNKFSLTLIYFGVLENPNGWCIVYHCKIGQF